MRIHTDTLTASDMTDAAGIARVQFSRFTDHGSRSRARSFDVLLTGESRRRPNSGDRGRSGDDYAATWDQWGVFLAVLFDRDPKMVTLSYYADAEDFHRKTADRFTGSGNPFDPAGWFWPADAHGDHTFRYAGTPCQSECTKCTARKIWAA